MKIHQVLIQAVLLFGCILAAGCGSKQSGSGTDTPEERDRKEVQRVESTEGN